MKAEQAIRAAIKNKLVTTHPGSLPVISPILEFIDTWLCYGFKLFGVDVVDIAKHDKHLHPIPVNLKSMNIQWFNENLKDFVDIFSPFQMFLIDCLKWALNCLWNLKEKDWLNIFWRCWFSGKAGNTRESNQCEKFHICHWEELESGENFKKKAYFAGNHEFYGCSFCRN